MAQTSSGRCTHLREPSEVALAVLRDPSLWSCQACGSTDGVWVCLECGHVGCGQRARLPSLGGGHARHHYLAAGPQHGSVCLDAVSKQLHCQACDDYVDGDMLASPPWLEALRQEMSALEMLPPSRTPSKHSEAGREWPASAPGCTGLSNLGNTCFINATLQALSHCKGFRDFFRDYVKAVAPMTLGNVRIDRMNTPAWKQQAEAEPKEEAHVTNAVHALLRVLWSGRYACISPHEMVQVVWNVGEQFASRRQHDAQEFLTFVLGRLSDECAGESGGGPVGVKSIMGELFGVEVRQTVQCHCCGGSFRRTERSDGLMVPLPEEGGDGGDGGEGGDGGDGGDGVEVGEGEEGEGGGGGGAAPLSLEACLGAVTAAHMLRGVDQFHCDHCGGKRDATRGCALGGLPPTLLLQALATYGCIRTSALVLTIHGCLSPCTSHCCVAGPHTLFGGARPKQGRTARGLPSPPQPVRHAGRARNPPRRCCCRRRRRRTCQCGCGRGGRGGSGGGGRGGACGAWRAQTAQSLEAVPARLFRRRRERGERRTPMAFSHRWLMALTRLLSALTPPSASVPPPASTPPVHVTGEPCERGACLRQGGAQLPPRRRRLPRGSLHGLRPLLCMCAAAALPPTRHFPHSHPLPFHDRAAAPLATHLAAFL